MKLVEENTIFTCREPSQLRKVTCYMPSPYLRWRHANDMAPALQGPLLSTLTPGAASTPREAPGRSHPHSTHTGLSSPPPSSPPPPAPGLPAGQQPVLWLHLLQISTIQATFTKCPPNIRVNVRVLEKELLNTCPFVCLCLCFIPHTLEMTYKNKMRPGKIRILWEG